MNAAASSWVICFEDKKFLVVSPSTMPPGVHLQVALADIPWKIHESHIFFGSEWSLVGSGEMDVNFYARRLAINLASCPFFQEPEWLHWISDQTQVHIKEWLSFSQLDLYFHTNKVSLTSETQVRFALAYLFWKGMFYYLRSGERWRSENAHFLYLLSTWQAFMQARYLAEIWLDVGDKPGSQKEKVLRWLNSELIELTRALDGILKSPEFREPIRMLLWRIEPPKQTAERVDLRYSPEERLFYGLVLTSNQSLLPGLLPGANRWSDNNAEKSLAGNQPIYIPVDSTDINKEGSDETWKHGEALINHVISYRFDWKEVRLHPVFTERKFLGLWPFTHKLIASWLLPRYDFSGAFHLARMLGQDQLPSRQSPLQMEKSLLIWGSVLILVMFLLGQIPAMAARWAAGNSLGCAGQTLNCDPYQQAYNQIPWLWNPCVLIIGVILVLGVLFFAVCQLRRQLHLDRQMIPYLLLPRLLGGITVGYAAIVLEGDSITLKNAFFAGRTDLWGWLLVLLLFVSVSLVSNWYFYHEAQARVQSEVIAKQRSLALFFITLIASFSIGLFAVSLTTAMEWQQEACQESILFACRQQGPFLIGPVGVIDLRQLVVFASLAMLTGLISQFLFEEKAITASIWEE